MTKEPVTTRIMGILNVTPDSFSDGGKFTTFEAALSQADKLIADGADILDVGGESTRPFADPVSTKEELERVLPIIKAVRKKHSIPISIDTSKAEVAHEALQAGADIINDISALQKDPKMLQVVQETTAPVIIMHMRGTPADMQIKPVYDNVVDEVITFLKERITWMTNNSIARNRIIIDPGIGFGKTLQHNLSILKNLEKLSILKLPVLLGHSRKRFLGDITGVTPEAERDLATAIVTGICGSKSLDIVRTHDVAATKQALLISRAIQVSM